MKRLFIFDVDDTIFNIDVLLKVLDDSGNVTQTLSGQQVYELSDEQIAQMRFCMHDYTCSKTFYEQAKPIPQMVDIVQKALNSIDDVIFVTARHGIDNLPRYIEKFHDHGMPILHDQVFFVGRWRPDERTKTSASEDKRVKFEEIAASQQYDHIVLYDDSHKNLNALYEVSLDFPVSVSLFLVSEDGTPRPYIPT